MSVSTLDQPRPIERRRLAGALRWLAMPAVVAVAHVANLAIPEGLYAALFFIAAVMVLRVWMAR